MKHRLVNAPNGQHGFRKTHGLRRSPEYNTWNGMKHRCHNPNYGGFRKYGARGITVCREWRDSFEAFYRDMGPKPSPDHSLERVDNNGPYSPENCRWATRSEQCSNKRNTIRLTLNGKTKLLVEWAAETGIDANTLRARVKSGWPDEDAVAKPLGFRHSGYRRRTRPQAQASK